MMPPHRKKLIEVAPPLDAVNVGSPAAARLPEDRACHRVRTVSRWPGVARR